MKDAVPFDLVAYKMQNAVNVSNSSIPGPEGVGLEKALNGYAKWTKEQLIPGCK